MADAHSSYDRKVYQDLRERLIDRTRRNRLLHFRHGTRSAIIRIVDEVPDLILEHLRNDHKFRFRPLPDPDGELPDEQTPAFRAALAKARVLDEEYRTAVAALDEDDPSAHAKEIRIERELLDRVRIELRMRPRPTRKSIDLTAYARDNGVQPAFDIAPPRSPALPKHADDWLNTLLFPDQLQSRLAGISRNVQAVEQETGVSTLHLAFGFLEWFESDDSETAFCSPLLLVPVTLERQRTRSEQDEFRLAALDTTAASNLSLELRLRELHLTLPSLEAECDNPIETYFTELSRTIRSFRRWRIRRFVTLAGFSFAGIAMYRDLDPANWTPSGGPEAHALVRPLLRAGADPFDAAAKDFDSEYDIDNPEIEQKAPVLVQDADSSQHSAIIDVMSGRNIVIEGPPGTGKSQTITNIIANVLNRNGTVLFLSEKMAALDVVKNRLDRVGLGMFCLPLHAAGAKPAAVIEALRRREATTRPNYPQANNLRLQAGRAKQELLRHIRAMREKVGPRDESVLSLIGRLAELTRLLPHLPSALHVGRHCRRQSTLRCT